MRKLFTRQGAFALMLVFLCLIGSHQVKAQGCVAIRGFSGCNGNIGSGAVLSKGAFLVGADYRYFKSFRHFRGSHEEENRIEEGTEVINHSHFMDFSVNYGITNRLYANVILPFVYHTRSSMYEHGGNPPNGLGERHTTKAYGLSDIRTSIGYWFIDPAKGSKGNFAAALGVKMPTGSYNYTDMFYNQGSDRDEDREAVVDQSIMPGDGGWGITLDLQGYRSLGQYFLLSGAFYYMSNPKETNGVLTRYGSSEYSCPDQYAIRLGTYYNVTTTGISIYLGGRMEGVPSSDLIGGSAGYRRPGYAISVEPGISYNFDRISIALNVPVAIVRNRTQSYSDKQRTEETGVYRHGDAAFADYLINVNVSYRFGGNHMPMDKSDLIN